MNTQSHVGVHLSLKSLVTHQQEFQQQDIIYLSIVNHKKDLAGYIVLIKENHGDSIQLRRILIDQAFLGIGQEAMIALEHYCMTTLSIKRIWLDVFKNNVRAIHLYEKLNYHIFKRGEENGCAVLFYEKILSQDISA